MNCYVLLSGHLDPNSDNGSFLVLSLCLNDSLREDMTIDRFLTIVRYQHCLVESGMPCEWKPSPRIYTTNSSLITSTDPFDESNIMIQSDDDLWLEILSYKANFVILPFAADTSSLSHPLSTSLPPNPSGKRTRSESPSSLSNLVPHVCGTQKLFTRTGTNSKAHPTFVHDLKDFFSTERPILLDRSSVIQKIEIIFSDHPLSKIVLLHHYDKQPITLIANTIAHIYDIHTQSKEVASIVDALQAGPDAPKFRIFTLDFSTSSPQNLAEFLHSLRKVLVKSLDNFCDTYSYQRLSFTEADTLEDILKHTLRQLSTGEPPVIAMIKEYDYWTNSLFSKFAQNIQEADTCSETSMSTWMASHLLLPLQDCPAIQRIFCFGRLPALLQEVRTRIGGFWDLSHSPALDSTFYVSELECKTILRILYRQEPTIPIYLDQRVAELKEFMGSYASCPIVSPSARRGHLRMSWLGRIFSKVAADNTSPNFSLRMWLEDNMSSFPLVKDNTYPMLISQAYFSVSLEAQNAFRECIELNRPLEYAIDEFTTLSYSMLPVRHSGPILPTESAISPLHVPILGGDDNALVALLVGVGLLSANCEPRQAVTRSLWSPPNKRSKAFLRNILKFRITPYQHMHMPGDIDALFNAVLARLEIRATRENLDLGEKPFQEIVLTMWTDSGSNHCDIPINSELQLSADKTFRFLDVFDKKRVLELKAASPIDIARGTYGIRDASVKQIDPMLMRMAGAIMEGEKLPAAYWDSWTETPLNGTDEKGVPKKFIHFSENVPRWLDMITGYWDRTKKTWVYERLDTRFGKGVAQAREYQDLLVKGSVSPKALSCGKIFIKTLKKEGLIKAEAWMLVAGKHIIRHKLPDRATKISYQTAPL